MTEGPHSGCRHHHDPTTSQPQLATPEAQLRPFLVFGGVWRGIRAYGVLARPRPASVASDCLSLRQSSQYTFQV